MSTFDQYGDIIRIYPGCGVLMTENNETCDCSFEAVQLSDGKVLTKCEFVNIDGTVLKCGMNGDLAIESVIGTTRKGQDFILEGKILCLNFQYQMKDKEQIAYMVLQANTMKVSTAASQMPKTIRFGLVNFEFMGNKIKTDGLRTSWDILELNLEGKTVEIHKMSDNEGNLAHIATRGETKVTSEALMQIDGETQIEGVILVVETVCRILSFARGTKINWIYYDCYDEDGNKTSSFHANKITRRLSGLRVIDDSNHDDTASFVEQAYTAYSQRDDTKSLNIALEEYLGAKTDALYLEARALLAIVVIELLGNLYTVRNHMESIVGNSKFNKIERALNPIIDRSCYELGLPDHLRQEIKYKIGELNRYSFRTVVNNMMGELGISIEPQLNELIKTRNSLVHRASFATTEYWSEYTLLIGILDRVFLNIFNYDGFFLDITRQFARTSTRQFSI